MKNKKEKYAAFGLLALVLLPLCMYSYFHARSTIENMFQMGGNRIELIEEFKQPEILQPGSVITKKIQVKNAGISECCIRIKAVFTTSDMASLCEIDWNETDWILKEDNFYYYKYILESQEVTNPLFTEIRIKEDAAENQIQPFDVLVYAESCQAEDGDTYESVWETYRINNPKEHENEVVKKTF